MYSFSGHLEHPGRFKNDPKLVKLLKRRLKRLERWYAYINRNKKLGKALSFLFGALELVIVEVLRFFSPLISNVMGRFSRLIDGKWGSKIVPLNVELGDVSTGVLPSQQILEIARRTPIRSLNWCYCHHTYGKKSSDEPDRYSCLALGWGQNLPAINSMAIRDPGKKIGKNLTYKEVEQKLEEWNKQGYVHQLIFFPSPDYFYIICACHPDYCLTLSNMKKWGFPAVVKADFVSTWNESLCENCGTCVNRCYFGAIIQGDQGRIEHDASKCVGCGLCVTTCSSGALKLDHRVKNR